MPDLKLRPEIKIIRFGWLDHTDWIAQTAATGQQARLSPEAYRSKLKILYQK
ncbi:ScaI family restriction endonuclease [Neisseria meningitidis]|nr:ScaI family restriction endonuclease [Neisseria meningitidis]